ncbi:MAG: NfeD family protein [Verrucomicrobiota bacterium JB023]|nr:NfeD family protein [Verrucomicrobiota bacterium JB023]
MKLYWLLLVSLLLSAFGLAEETPKRTVFGRSQEQSYEGKVVVIEVGEKDLLNDQSFRFFRRTLNRVNDEKAKAVIFDLNTPGGQAFLTAELMMNEMSELEVPSFAFVNPKALSAGALIAMATDHIYMKPVSTIGAAGLISGTGQEIGDVERAKLESAFDAFVSSVVIGKGHNEEIARAMMFEQRSYEFGEISVPEGELLSLRADQAVSDFEGRPLLAKGIVSSLEEILARENLQGAEVVVAEMTGFERIAYWLKFLAPILILVGLGAGYLEMKTPGFGVGAIVSACAFALFFFGNYVAGNLAGYELAAIFVLGVALILVDIFLFPGTFILGITGVVLSIGALLFSMVDRLTFEDAQQEEISIGWLDALTLPLAFLACGLVGTVILVSFMMKYLPTIPLFNRYLLPATIDGVDSGVPAAAEAATASLIGQQGIATTDLRPAGRAEINGQILDVTSETSFVEEGATVVVLEQSPMRIVVREV